MLLVNGHVFAAVMVFGLGMLVINVYAYDDMYGP